MLNGWKPEYEFSHEGPDHIRKWYCSAKLTTEGVAFCAKSDGTSKRQCEKLVRLSLYKQLTDASMNARAPRQPELMSMAIEHYLRDAACDESHNFAEIPGGWVCTSTFTVDGEEKSILSAGETQEKCLITAKKEMVNYLKLKKHSTTTPPAKLQPLNGIRCLNIIDSESIAPEKIIQFNGPIVYFWRAVSARPEIAKSANEVDTLLPFQLKGDISYCVVDYNGPEAVDHWISASVNTILKCAKDMGLEGITISSIDKSAVATLAIFKKLIEAYHLKIEVELLDVSFMQRQTSLGVA